MNDSRFTFLFQKKQRMNFFAAASSSDDEENERPLRSFIPAVTAAADLALEVGLARR